jgi:hypothetical protein
VLLIAALLADLVEDLVDPTGDGSATKLFDAASHDQGLMIASAIALLATSVLVVPAVFVIVRTLEDRGRWIGRVAAGLALFGAIGHAALAALYIGWAALPSPEASSEQMIAAIDRMTSSAWFVLLLPFVVAFPLSLIATFIALVRGRVAPRWILAPVLAAPVATVAVPGSDTTKTGIALVLLLIAACGLAWRAFRRTPEPEALTALAHA